MKNFTLCLLFAILPFFSILNAQCFDLSALDIQACPGEEVTLTLTISGGEAPYSVAWMGDFDAGSGTVTEQDGSFTLFVNVSSNFTFTVTDNTNCTEMTSSLVEFPTLIQTNISSTDPSCGDCNGTASIDVTGGFPPYTYLWSTGNIGPQVVFLCIGNYSVTITDNIGCQENITFSLLESDELFIEIESVTDISCAGSADGAIEVQVTGGTGGFNFLWSGPNNFSASSQDITGIAAGVYNLLVTDVLGCSFPISVVVSEASMIEIEYSTSGVACQDEGFISIDNITGGVPPYTYALDSDLFTNASTFDNLISGVYLISVMDSLGCIAADTITIESQIALELSSSFSDCDSLGGSALATIIGGATDPVFTWSNGTVGPEITNVAPGGYSVTVTDNLTNCVTHQNVEVLYDPDCFVHISGRVILDFENEDCVEDSGSSPAAFVLVALSNGDLTFTDTSGYFEFETEPGIYDLTIDLDNSSFDPLCADPISVSVPDFGDISEENNFYVTYPDNQDLAVSIASGPVRPGFDQTVTVYARNKGGFPIDGTVTFSHDPLQTLLSSIPVADDYNLPTTTLSWDFENLTPGDSKSFVVELNLPPTVALGTDITYTATIAPTENDINLANNTKIIQRIVTGSFDPNDKQVSPRGEGPTGSITRADSILNYQIRFQNTGTDTAFTVIILDEIEENLDITTVRPGASSHPYQLNVIDGKTLEFRFENIMLPDSFVNEPASNGFVLFEIHTKQDLPFGSTFENTAEIFFDFNEPIITNTVINTLTAPVSVADLTPRSISTRISPNPGGNESILFYNLEEATVLTVGIYDLNGRLVRNLLQQERKDAGAYQLGLEGVGLPQGVYLIRVVAEDGRSATQKWVKMEN